MHGRILTALLAVLISACGGGSANNGNNGNSGPQLPPTNSLTVYMPLMVYSNSSPVANSEATALYALPSTTLTYPPVLVANQPPILPLGYAQQLTVTAPGAVTAGNPTKFIYMAAGQIWALELTPASTLVPVQVGNFPANLWASACASPNSQGQSGGANLSCEAAFGYQNLADPNSAFFILAFAGKTAGAAQQGVLVHLTDTPTTPPINLPCLGSYSQRNGIQPLYTTNGLLAGLVANDCSGNLNWYSDLTFTNPKQLLQGATVLAYMQAPSVSSITLISAQPSFAFADTSIPNPATNGNSRTLFRIDSTGSISAGLYDFNPDFVNQIQYWTDSTNLYFADGSLNNYSYDLLLQAPLDGSAAATVVASPAQTAGGLLDGQVGFAGGQWVFFTGTSIYTTPVNGAWNPTVIAQNLGLASGNLALVFVSGSNIYLDTLLSTGPPTSMVFAGDGSVISPPTPNREFNAPTTSASAIWELTPSGTLYMVNANSSLSSPLGPLLTPNGTPLVVPFDTNYGSPSLSLGAPTVFTTNIGIVSENGVPYRVLYAYDLSRSLIAPISFSGSLVLPFPPFGTFGN